MVLSDIFRRLDETREKRRRKEGEIRREEYAVLLDVYKQELERDRIPRRMPDIDEWQLTKEGFRFTIDSWYK